MTARRLAALAVSAVAGLAGCGSGAGSSAGGGSALVALVVPRSTDPSVAATITRGAQLAVTELNASGVVVNGARVTLETRVYDDGGDPERAASAVATAGGDGAVAVIADGAGAKLAAATARSAGIPLVVTADGVTALGDGSLPAVFRLGVGNAAAATLLSTYIGSTHRGAAVAVLHDDSDEGRDAAAQLSADLPTAGLTLGDVRELSATATAVDAPLTAVRQSAPGALVVWGGAAFTAHVLAAAHAAGLAVPLYCGPEGRNPVVRQVAGAAATDGVAFVAARMTSEVDESRFGQFEHRLAAATGGPIDAGVKDAAGEEIRQPADTDYFAYDAVRLVAAALHKAGTTAHGGAVLAAFVTVTVTSANGDSRGFRADTHEGIADGDLYVARLHDMQYQPVGDEPLSATLPRADQVLSHFH